ncbi:MAG: deoxyribonuclease IV [Dehalococcoidia bacterium]|nr:deoxyribonuclease IV [Dehalococcoidia bacterium]
MKIGAHVSAAGGVDKAIDRAQEMGCETIQLSASSPRSWAFKPLADTAVQAFREKSTKTGIKPAFLHAIYMINLGTGDPVNLEKSVDSLTKAMQAAGQIGAQGVIFHVGSHKGAGYDGVFKQVVGAMEKVLKQSPKEPYLMIENSAGMGQHLGSSFEEVGQFIKALQTKQVRVCLDTQHAFAAGYDLRKKGPLAEAMEKFDQHIGLERLIAVHANDSKQELGSGVDRHENIGEGKIGTAGFETIMANPAFKDVNFLLEVPGFENMGPDKENVDRLKAARAKIGGKR